MDIQSIQCIEAIEAIEGLDDFVVFLEIIEGYFIENGLKLSYKIENVYKLINNNLCFHLQAKIKKSNNNSILSIFSYFRHLSFSFQTRTHKFSVNFS